MMVLLRARLAAALLLIGIALASTTGLTGPGWAQTTPAIDYKAWEKDATRAEEVLTFERPLNSVMEQTRATISNWRKMFLDAQNANAAKIATLKEQLASLGPTPTEEAPDAPEIADRRRELTDQLAQLQAPAITAVEAHSRADGIIRQLDAKTRARQADALLKLSPTPINPVNWPAAAAVLTQGMKTLWEEASNAWQHPANRAELRNNLPAIIFYLLIAAVFVLRGPGLIEAWTRRLNFGTSVRAREFVAGLISLGQIIVPVGGMFFLVLALRTTGMLGTRSDALISALPVAALAFFVARWLGGWLFRPESAAPEKAPLTDRPTEARFHVTMMGLVIAAEILRISFVTEVRPPLSLAAKAVWATPLTCLLAILLFRLGLLLRRRATEVAAMPGTTEFSTQILRLVSNAVLAISVVGPTLAIIGYVAAAHALIWPTAMSLGLAGLTILIQHFTANLFLMITRGDKDAEDALVPVLIGLVLWIATLPVFAIIWGARTTDLIEAWTQFSAGISIGQTRISPSVFLTFVLVFAVGYMVTRLLQGALRSTVLPRTGLEKGVQNALTSGIGYLGIFLAAVAAIVAAGIDLSSLAIVAGALSVGIGFGLQNIVSNFVAGIILLIERPISEGDMIQVGNEFGIVKSISVRSTRIETFDRTDVIVPNADLVSGVVTNLTRGNLTGRLIIPIGVAYGSDTRRVETILHEIAEAQPMVLIDPPPTIYFVGFGADSLNFEIRSILSDVNFKLAVQSEILHQVAARFAEEGIEIPFPQRDLWIRNPETLREGKARPKPGRRPTATADPVAPETPVETAPRMIDNDPTGDDGDVI